MPSWPRIRALLIVLHLFAITAMALPAPAGGMNRSSWKDKTVQQEFAAWTERVNGLGWEIDKAEFEEMLWDISVSWMGVRQKILDPFFPYYRYFGTWQSWRMFVAPHRYPARLEIAVLDAGTWRTVYAARSNEFTWMRSVFDHDRMRSAVFRYSWSRYRKTWPPFVDWIARHAAEDFPEADSVRVRFWKYETRSPEEVRQGLEPDGKWIQTRAVKLAGLR